MRKIISIYKNVYRFSILLIILILQIIIVNGDPNIAVISFKSFLPKENNIKESKSLISSWVYRKIYLDIQSLLGQKISMLLNYEQPLLHTNNITAYSRSEDKYISKYTKNISDICSFNYHYSNTYQLLSNYNISFYSISQACYASEKMIFYNDINLSHKSTFNIKFIHSSNDSHNCFLAGLILTNSLIDKEFSLFHQLKQLTNAENYDWALYFTSPNEGKFIFGDVINNDKINLYKDNNKNNYIKIQVNSLFSLRIYWKIKIDKIIVGNHYVKEINNYFEVDIHIRYISVPKNYFDDIKALYLLDKGKDNLICFEEITDWFFHTIYCDKSEYIKLTKGYDNLPELNLNFISNGEIHNISFSSKDLFLEIENYIYFFIGYNSRMTMDEKYVFGSLLLEKYITVFNNEEKTLNILKKKEENNKMEIVDNNSSTKIILIVMLVFILSAVIFILVGKLFGKKLFVSRKKKANELIDDDYDYTPNINNNAISFE